LAFLGIVWVCGVLLWHFPWLLRVALYAHVAIVLFGLSFLLIATHVYERLRALIHQLGVAQFVPCIVGLLTRPLYQLLVEFNQSTMWEPFLNVVRLLLLAFYDLGDTDRTRILEEMTPAFREAVFQRPALLLLPRVLQCFALGVKNLEELEASLFKMPPPCPCDAAHGDKDIISTAPLVLSPEQDGSCGDSCCNSYDRCASSSGCTAEPPLPTASHQEPSISVDDMLLCMKSAEDAARSLGVCPDPSLVQKILLSRIAYNVTSSVAEYSCDAFYNSVVQGTYVSVSQCGKRAIDRMTSPPHRLLLRVPWEAARFTAKATKFVLHGLITGSTPALRRNKHAHVRVTFLSKAKARLVENTNADMSYDDMLQLQQCDCAKEAPEEIATSPEWTTPRSLILGAPSDRAISPVRFRGGEAERARRRKWRSAQVRGSSLEWDCEQQAPIQS